MLRAGITDDEPCCWSSCWLVLLACVLAVAALAAEPSAAPVGLLAGGDPRSEGGGPGLVGSPLAMLLGVVALGLVTALADRQLLARLRRPLTAPLVGCAPQHQRTGYGTPI